MRSEELGALFNAYQARLYRLARRLSSDPEEARDLVQDAFLRAARSPRGVPVEPRHAEAWLVRTLVNLCRDRRRRLAVRARAAEALEGSAPRSGSSESALVARATVQAGLSTLSPRRRAVLVLHELEELGVAEVARLLGVAQVTVRWHLAAARRDLRRFVELGAARMEQEKP